MTNVMDKTRLTWLLIGVLILIIRVETTGGISRVNSKATNLQEIAQPFLPVQQYLTNQVKLLLPEPQQALLAGILLGVQSDLPTSLKQDLQTTSTIHIAVVSGQNLTLLVGFMMSLASLFGRKKTVILSLCVSLIYSLITGLQVPVIRAAIMVDLALIAQLLGRDKESYWILLLTGLAMLIYNPSWILSVSFQLSFLATIGAVIVAPKLGVLLKSVPDLIREDLSVSLAAQALTMPVIAATFHQISLIGVLANMFILWTIGPIMISAILAILISFIFLPLGELLALIPGILITYLIYMVNFFASLPLAAIKVQNVLPIVWLGYYLLLISLIWLVAMEDKQVQD